MPHESGPNDTNDNPFVAPNAQAGEPITDPLDLLELRRRHLSKEASVKTVGLIYGLGAVIMAANAIIAQTRPEVFAIMAENTPPPFGPSMLRLLAAVGSFGSAAFMVVLGVGLWKLSRLARWMVVVLSLIAVALALPYVSRSFALSSPLTLIFNIGNATLPAVIAVILGSPATTPVFREEYKQAIAFSPDIRSRMSWLNISLVVVYLIVRLGTLIAYWSRM